MNRIISKVLLHRRWPWAVALLAAVLLLPSIGGGMMMDDLYHRLVLSHAGSESGLIDSPLDMFRFFDGDPARTQRMMDLGVVPWWTDVEIRARFFRPVTVLMHWLDYRLWPDTLALMHLQSIAWYAALVVLAGGLYRRVFGPAWAAGLATLLYGLDDAHAMPVAWLANRNAVIAAVFGVAAIAAHVRGGTACGGRAWLWRSMAAAAFVVSLLSAEFGIGALAYLLAFAVVLDRGTWRRRALSVLPYVAIVVVWRGAWTAMGYGVEHLGLYVDPGARPWAFAQAVGVRAPLLLMGQWIGVAAELYAVLGDGWRMVMTAAGVGVTIGLAVLLWPLLRGDRVARFWGLGMVMAVVPACAAMPADRLLFFVGLGAMGLLAQFLVGAFGTAAWRPRALAWRAPMWVVGGLFVLIHVVAAPVSLVYRAMNPIGPRAVMDSLMVRMPVDASIAEQDLVIVNAPSAIHALYFGIERQVRGEPAPRRMRVLAPAFPSVTVERTDARTIEVEVKRGYLRSVLDELFRTPERALRVGDVVTLTGMRAKVLSVTPDGRPSRVAFTFDVPLEDASLRWLQYRGGRFVPFTPPAVGERVTLRPDAPRLLKMR